MNNKSILENLKPGKQKEINKFSNEYKTFLNSAKTERLVCREVKDAAKRAGFKRFDDAKELNVGNKVYFTNKEKNIILFILGENILSGIKILGAHLDSPRLDLKPHSIIEANGFTLFDTHYYGSIKNYQFTAIPLAIHGIIYKADGSRVDVNIGENDDDPIIGIPDLLIHLSSDQLEKTGSKVIEAEDLDVIIGSLPYKNANEEDLHTKNESLKSILKGKYGISEEDLISAELEIVPAIKARDFGLDKTMISGYGHDDKAAVFAILKAVLEIDNPSPTICAAFFDKEESGNYGAVSADSRFFENCILEILNKLGYSNLLDLRRALQNSVMLSCDAAVALDPIYGSVSDLNNCAKFNHGTVFEKYLGYGGKSGTNDASPELLAKLVNLADKNNIFYQIAESSKVGAGGAGTFSYIFARYNMEIIDCGIPVLNMHSPMEIISKADLYESYLFYKAFYQTFRKNAK